MYGEPVKIQTQFQVNLLLDSTLGITEMSSSGSPLTFSTKTFKISISF